MLYNNFDYSTKYTKQIGIKENNPIYLEDKSVYIRRKVQYFPRRSEFIKINDASKFRIHIRFLAILKREKE